MKSPQSKSNIPTICKSKPKIPDWRIEAKNEVTQSIQTTILSWNQIPPSFESTMVKHHQTTSSTNQEQEEEEDIYNILLPNVGDLPLTPPSAVQSNFISYFAADFLKPRHDQYVYRHANGLCVIGLASTHLAFKEQEGGGGGNTTVDFNVGKSNRSEMKVTGKRKRNLKY
ncbi:hypothetical protein CsatB_025884 [Cannabis sativa]